MSIRIRLTLWYSGVLVATLLIFGFAIYFFVNYNTYADIKSRMHKEADNIELYAADFMDKLDLRARYKSGSFEKDLYIQLVNYQEPGVLLASPNMSEIDLRFSYPGEKSRPKEGFNRQEAQISETKYQFIIYQKPVHTNDGKLVGLLQIGAYVGSEVKFLSGLRTILVIYSIIAVFIAATVGLFLARKALRPIEGVIRSTKQIEKGSDLSVRIPSRGPNDEIGRLAETLNSMLSRLEMAYNELDEAYKAQRRFVSDASHELRTPLTTIRGNIDLLEKMWSKARQQPDCLLPATEHWELSQEAMQDISSEAKRMSTLVNDLLSLARADAGYVMEKQPLKLQLLAEEVARRAQLLPRTSDWTVGDLTAVQDVEVFGNQDYLQQLLFIFIENAFKYTPQGTVELSALLKGEQAGIVIRDTGIGMNPEEVPHIFDRFYRADESRGQTVGTGLGLSIAKWIIDEHKGAVEVRTREGEGTTFVIWLPVYYASSGSSSIIEGD
ncbi:sensor histidine kinase [Paenibacillus sp. GCM10023252]|uniref:sensor histidine kinase n=1 Tax=Paenibacillus sp. GCM10023252 TaxID=3252649 RepID=UPI00360C3111